MAKKAKWLEEGTQESLLVVIKETLSADEIDPKAQKKALNATNELIERLPQGEVTIIDNLDNLVKLATTVKDQYNTEADMVSDDEEVEDEDLTEDEVETEKELSDYTKKELLAMAKELGLKANKKMAPADIIALIEEAQGSEDELDDEDAEDEDGDSVELEDVLGDLSLKELKSIAKEAGIASKGKKQGALIEELVAHEDIIEILEGKGLLDEEDTDSEDDEDEEVDYSEMSKGELKSLLKERGFKVSKKATVAEMIETLENN